MGKIHLFPNKGLPSESHTLQKIYQNRGKGNKRLCLLDLKVTVRLPDLSSPLSSIVVIRQTILIPRATKSLSDILGEQTDQTVFRSVL